MQKCSCPYALILYKTSVALSTPNFNIFSLFFIFVYFYPQNALFLQGFLPFKSIFWDLHICIFLCIFVYIFAIHCPLYPFISIFYTMRMQGRLCDVCVPHIYMRMQCELRICTHVLKKYFLSTKTMCIVFEQMQSFVEKLVKQLRNK